MYLNFPFEPSEDLELPEPSSHVYWVNDIGFIDFQFLRESSLWVRGGFVSELVPYVRPSNKPLTKVPCPHPQNLSRFPFLLFGWVYR